MQVSVGLNGEAIAPEDCARFQGVGMVRGEYLCRQSNGWILDSDTQAHIASHLSRIAEIFAPRPVWYRMIDMEASEANGFQSAGPPIFEKTGMLGLRGIRRGIERSAELDAELTVAAELAKRHSNLHVLVPFVRDEEDAAHVVERLRALGFGNDIGAMIEIPSAVYRTEEIVRAGMAAITVGMNDLTSLILGAYRGSGYDRKDHPAVRAAVRDCVVSAKRAGASVSVAGYLSRPTLEWMQGIGVEVAVVQYSHLAEVWPEKFGRISDGVDLVGVKNAIRRRLGDPEISGGLLDGARTGGAI